MVERCPLCQSGEHRIFEHAQDGDHTLTYQLCESCGMVFQSPRMSYEELKEFYQAEYRLLVQGEEGPSEKDLRAQAGRARNLLKLTRRQIVRVDIHLDIGSSTGALLEAFRECYECLSFGIEPGDLYRLYSQERGLRVEADLSDLDSAQIGKADLISLAHVLEHLPDPINYLKILRREWLTPDGHLLIEVPNLYGHPSLELAHLTAFSSATLRETLRSAGFQPLMLRVHGGSRSRLIPLYLTTLARRMPEASFGKKELPSSRGVLTRRRFGNLWRAWVSRIAPGWAWLLL